MKKILMALTMTGLTYCSAEAQTDSKKNCEVIQTQVCSKGRDCYKTKYAENFKVCKNNRGYFICCETADYNNSTHPMYVVDNQQASNPNDYVQTGSYAQNEASDATVDNTVPQSQSYAGYSIIKTYSYEGYYPQKGKMRSCYVGNNVAEETRAPYKGCPSPQDDGPERNRERNVNVSNPAVTQ